MNKRKSLLMLSLLLAFVGIGFVRIAVTFAQEHNQVYLPLIANGQQQSTAEATAVATPTSAPNRWTPLPTATATAMPNRTYPTWLPGTYNVRFRTGEGWSEFRTDGTFSEQLNTFSASASPITKGKWFVADNELVVEFVDTAGKSIRRHFMLEKVEGEGFRIAAGDAKLEAYLYERMTPVKAVDGQYVSQWVRGRWDAIFQAFLFNEDGTYDLYETSPYGELKTLIEQGEWSAAANRMVIQPKGEILANSTYTITTATDGYLKLTSATKALSLLRKTWYPPASMSEYEGQYIAGNMTLTVKKATDANYTATLLLDGVPSQATGVVDEYGRLVLTKANGELYPPLQRHFNALVQDGYSFPQWLVKVSGTTLPEPGNHAGLWMEEGLSYTTELWLLPDGRYFRLSNLSSSNAQGTYTLGANTITFDPICEKPYTYSVSFTGDQMVQTSGSTTFTYHYVPSKLPDLLASIASRDEAESNANAEFAAHTVLAAVNPTYVSPAIGEISVDEHRTDIYPNAITFANEQLYDWYTDVTYYFDKTGNFVGVSPLLCAINPSLCANINYGLGSWKDKYHYYFYPNGRFLVYYETYVNAISLSPVTPTIQRWWGKYRIKNETIISESDQFPLALGRRRVMFGENCLDNVASSSVK